MWKSRQVRTQPRQFYLGILLLTVSGVLAQNVLATATDQSYGDSPLDKDNDMPVLQKRPAFFVGSRYGRSSSNAATASGSGPAASMGSSKTRRLIIVPRNDRFFLGSRYGKRNGEYLSPYEQNSLGRVLGKEPLNSGDNVSTRPSPGALMSCVYTGIGNFYRCSNANNNELNNIINSSGGDDTLDDSASMAAEDTNTK